MAMIAFIGLGNMGGPMAANLVKAGHKVVAFDLVEASRSQAKADGASIADSASGAVKGADVLIAVSRPGPAEIKMEWIEAMAEKPIVFAEANPVPEIYPHRAKRAGAYIVATGRGDYPNQVNNSLGFPGILKGALMVHARKVSDKMAIAAARAIARFAEERGKQPLGPDYIIPTMDEVDVYPFEAAEVAAQAVKDGVARLELGWQEVYEKTKSDIAEARELIQHMMDEGFIPKPPKELVEEALKRAVAGVRHIRGYVPPPGESESSGGAERENPVPAACG